MQKALNDTKHITLGFRQKITPPFISKSVAVFREKGFKAGLKSLGWKTLASHFRILFGQGCDHLHPHPVFRGEGILRILSP
jgi:hypothetical protein